VYLLEGFYVLPTRKSAKFHEILRKFETKLGNNPVGKKVNTPNVNTWVNAFLRKYPGCLKVNTFYFWH